MIILLVLIIFGFHICHLAHLLSYFGNTLPQTNNLCFCRHVWAKTRKRPECPSCLFPAEVKQSNFAFWFSSHAVHECLFQGLSSAMLFVFLLEILLFQMAPKYSTEGLSYVPKCKKAVMSLMKKARMLDRIYAGISYRTVSCEFNVHESTIYIK